VPQKPKPIPKKRDKTFIEGKPYTKEYFGIKNIRSGTHIVYGRLCLFFTMKGQGKNEFNDEEVKDGFIFEARHEYELVPEGSPQDMCASIFTREKPRGPFTYRGDVHKARRHDKDRNKLLW
jgi:hypothetical protein